MSADLQLEDIKYSLSSSLAFTARGSVGARQRWVIQGPSGCGKSTFLRALAGLLPLDAGHLRLGERELGKLPPSARRCGYVFQSGALFRHLDVMGNLLFGMKNFLPELSETLLLQRARQMLERFQLESLDHRDVDSLSGGERQRIALARTLLCEPAYLLLDEPLSAVDAESRERLQRQIVEAHELNPIPFIAVTHDPDEAKAIGTHWLTMKAGDTCIDFR